MKALAVWSAAGIMLLVGGGAGTAHAAVDMQGGEWETTINTTVSMPGESIPPMVTTIRECLTPKDAVPGVKEENCKITKLKEVGNKVFWSMVCEEKGSRTEGEGEVTYHRTSYQGTIRGKVIEGGETMKTLMKISGKRLGPCSGNKTRVNDVEVEKLQAMAGKAKAEGDAAVAKAKTPSKRAAAILNAKVPEKEPNACLQKGFTLKTACQEKKEKLRLEPGLYEVVVETTQQFGEFYGDVTETKESICLTRIKPVPGGVGRGDDAEVAWGNERIVWSQKDLAGAERGGIVYRGAAFEGVVSKTSEQPGGAKTVTASRIRGKRLGGGNCVSRDYTAAGRSYTSQPKEESPAGKTKELLKNPVKGIRDFFKF